MTVFASAALALQGLIRRLTGGASCPEATLTSAVSGLESASRQLRVHLAELAMALGRTHRQLGELSPEEALHGQLAAQTAAMTERLGRLRIQLADLEGKVLQLKSLQADLRLHGDLKVASSRLRHILADLPTDGTDPLAELAGALTDHAELRATLVQLQREGLLG